MTEKTVKKVQLASAPRGAGGQVYLVSGKGVSMRFWDRESPGEKEATVRDYETVGFVLEGRARLHLEGQVVDLEQSDSWLVPKGAEHRYEILEPFTAVEATAPPAQVHGRDE